MTFPIDENLFADKPWTQLPKTEEDEEEQDFSLPEDIDISKEDEEDSDEDEYNQGPSAAEYPSYEDSDQPVEQPSQDYGLPEVNYGELEEEFGEDRTPAGFKQLFDPKGKNDLTKLTETPPKMVLPLVRARIIDAAYDQERIARGQSLLSVFVEEFDERMISKDRKGRIEAVNLIQGLSSRREEDEEEASL